MIPPAVLNNLLPKLHTIVVRGVADALRIWLHEAIIPERHLKPPPPRGAGKDVRLAAKERAKVCERPSILFRNSNTNPTQPNPFHAGRRIGAQIPAPSNCALHGPQPSRPVAPNCLGKRRPSVQRGAILGDRLTHPTGLRQNVHKPRQVSERSERALMKTRRTTTTYIFVLLTRSPLLH